MALRPTRLIALVAVLAAACNSADLEDKPECGPGDPCPDGLVCDAREQVCRAGGASAPDAAAPAEPTTTITPLFDAATPVADATVSFELTATPRDAGLECRVGDGPFRACASPFAATPGEGTFTFEARAIAGGVTEPSPARITFTIDLTAPAVTITSPADGATVGAPATLELAVDEPAALIECAFDGGAFAPCGSGTRGSAPIPPDLSDGAHTATARAIDHAGNRGAATVGFTIDRTVLAVTIAPRSSPCLGEALSFSANVAAATFTCELDGARRAACTSPFQLPPDVTSGAHVFSVSATAGAATATSSLPFLVDTSRPEVRIDATIPAPDAAGRFDAFGVILFHSSKPGVARCGIDGGDPIACPVVPLDGIFAYESLDDAHNPHRFKVEVTDACGNHGAAVQSFDVDSTPPAPCFVDARTLGGRDVTEGGACLDAPTTGRNGSLIFDAEPGTYRCTITTEIPAGQQSGFTSPPLDTPFDCAPGEPISFGLHDFGDEGHPYTLVVEGTDVHFNRSRSELTWTVDTTGPTVTLGAASASARDGTLVVAYTVGSAADVREGVTMTCTLDGVACACGATGTTCGKVSAGAHTLTVSARDAFANTGPPAAAAHTMTYGPAGGRAILLGFDLHAASDDATALLRAAVTDVPWKKSGAFDRPLRLLTYEGGAPDPAEIAHVDAALGDLVSARESFTFSDPAMLATLLVGKDVLLVVDQNDPASARATGERWAGDPALRAFLDAGGVVVVLDGWRDGGDGAPLTSDSWQLYAAGDDPILGVFAAKVDGPGRQWFYAATQAELLFGAPSELRTAALASPADGAVSFDVTDAELARGTYFSGEDGPTVVEKIFPVYTPAIGDAGGVRPGVPFSIAPGLPDADVAAVQCVVLVERCDNVNGCCPGPDPAADRCACPVVDAVAHTFLGPSRSGLYTVAGRILSPRTPRDDPASDPAPRPGRSITVDADVPQPDVRLAQIVNASGPTGRFCFGGTAPDGAPLPPASFVPQVFIGGVWVDRLPFAAPDGCPAGDVGSFSTCTNDPSGQIHVRVNVVDPDGNAVDLVRFNQTVPRCP